MSAIRPFVILFASAMLVAGLSGCGLFKKSRAVDSESTAGDRTVPYESGSSGTSGPRTAPIILNEGQGGISGGSAGGAGKIDPSTIDDRTLAGVNPQDLHRFVDPSNPLSKRIIYFEYDSDSISSAYRSIVEAHARYLKQNPGTKVRLEGHADERGTREYNIALGERRAKSVQRAMSFSGAGSSQLSTLSYGEERPVVRGSGEGSYSQNRRVEIVYYR